MDAVLTRRGKGTNSAQKNQLLFQRFGINYNNIPERTRKGSVIVREVRGSQSLTLLQLMSVDQVSTKGDALDVGDKGGGKKKGVMMITVLHCDLVRGEFWKERPHILLE